MAKSKLITAIKSLTAKEISVSKKNIKAKYSSSRPELIKLFEACLLQIDQDQFDKLKAWKKVYKNHVPFNDTKWRAMLMILNSEVVNLIMEQYLLNNGLALHNLIELSSYHKRNLPKFFSSPDCQFNRVNFHKFNQFYKIKLKDSVSIFLKMARLFLAEKFLFLQPRS